MDPHLETRFTGLVGVRWPIVQTGMGWVAGSSLTSATSSAGALGILASATMSLSQLEDAIRKVSDRTANPFGVNLRPEMADLTDRIALMSRSGVRVASFAGPPSAEVVRRLRDEGIVVIATVGAPRHAEKMAGIGVDAVIAQGAEGGGHTGSIPTSLLVPAVVGAVGGDICVLAAGGMHSGRGLVAALAWGADGIAMGTRFLLTQESRVPDGIKREYLAAPLTGTLVTKAIDGRPQRVISTPFVRRLQRSLPLLRSVVAAIRFRRATSQSLMDLVHEGAALRRTEHLTLSQVAMAANAPMMTRKALVEGDPSAGILPSGQVVGVIETIPTVSALLDEIVSEATWVISELAENLIDHGR